LSLAIQENELLKRAKMCWLFYGSPEQRKIKHIETFLPLVEYIREHFSEAYEFVENSYKVVVERNEDEDDDE
jgi:hypothetical protein